MKKIDEFKLKDGREVDIVLPSMDLLKPYTDFINRLSKEDTFLYLSGEIYTYAAQKNWLENALQEIKFNKHYFVWAYIDGKIVGNCDLRRGGNRETHVGTVGLFIDSDFRGLGLGKLMVDSIIKKSKSLKYQILRVEVFSDNEVALNLYQKFGFAKCGQLLNGLYRKNKYSDKIEMFRKL